MAVRTAGTDYNYQLCKLRKLVVQLGGEAWEPAPSGLRLNVQNVLLKAHPSRDEGNVKILGDC
jgi:hypothetical protein